MYQKSRRRPRWLRMLGLDLEYVKEWRKVGLSSLVLLGVILLALSHTQKSDSQFSAQHFKYSLDSSEGRRLLSTPSKENGSKHGPVWEACDFEMSHIPGLWIFIHTILILIIFIALAIICDDFFVPSLEAISEKLHLSEDVAGATFMAAGSSAPELFTSVAGVAVRTDVGVGTIVGSAIFNLLIIIALTAALAGQVLHLDWRPLVRDSFFYAMSIACFIGFSWDGYFTHYESVILLSLYILYIVLMIFNAPLMDWMGTWKCCFTVAVQPEAEGKEENPVKEAVESPVGQTTVNMANNNAEPRKTSVSMAGGHARRVSIISQRSVDGEKTSIFHHHQRGSLVAALAGTGQSPLSLSHIKDYSPRSESVDGERRMEKMKEEEEVEEDETCQICPCIPCCPAVRTSIPSAEEARAEGGCMGWVKFVLKWIIFVPAFPFVCLFSWTIPDCSKPHNRKWFLVSFLISVLWIALLSFTMVTLVSRCGCILKVDTYVMGLVIIAIGTSVPDCLSSILVARDGYGDMAVSNAIGSNVFDINLGLGLPFALRIAIDAGAPISLLSAEEWQQYHNGEMLILPHAKFGFVLLLVLLIALLVFTLARFRLSAVIGVSFVTMYIMFLTYAFVQELYCVQKLGINC